MTQEELVKLVKARIPRARYIKVPKGRFNRQEVSFKYAAPNGGAIYNYNAFSHSFMSKDERISVETFRDKKKKWYDKEQNVISKKLQNILNAKGLDYAKKETQRIKSTAKKLPKKTMKLENNIENFINEIL